MIGVFDSGIGGLTVFKELKEKLPHTSLVYFADTLHLPYGEKEVGEIKTFTKNITTFLLKQNINALVIACNTASAIGRDSAKEVAPALGIYDVIQPTVKKAIGITKNRKVGIIGTKAAMSSNAYSIFLERESFGAITPIQRPTPLLVPMIEKGILTGKFDEKLIRESIIAPEFEGIDTLILGCTHYPLIKEYVQKILAEEEKNIEIVNSSDAVCEDVIATLKEKDTEETPQYLFFASKVTPELEEFTSRFLNEQVTYTQVLL